MNNNVSQLCVQQAGSVHVRIRRDADEQMVLAHVVNRLSNLVPVLTVQVFKDDWTRPSAYQILGDSSIGANLSSGSPMKFPLTATSPEKPKQFTGSTSYQSIRPFTPLTPLGSFPSFPGVGASISMTTSVPSSFSVDSSLGGKPPSNRQPQNIINPFSPGSYRSPLPDVLPASMNIGSSYPSGRASSLQSVGAVIGLPVNESVRLGIPNVSNQMSPGYKPS